METLASERYREAHIPGALNIPPEWIKELAPQLLPKKGAEIVTYCATPVDTPANFAREIGPALRETAEAASH